MQNSSKKKKFNIQHWQMVAIPMAIYDFAVAILAYFLALWLRFDCRLSNIGQPYWHAFCQVILIYAVLCVIAMFIFKLYRSMWRFVSYAEFFQSIFVCTIMSAIHAAGITLFFQRMPISYYVLGWILQTIFTTGIRLTYRAARFFVRMHEKKYDSDNVMIIGAGEAGNMILRDMQRSNTELGVVKCIIDDNPNKWNRFVGTVPIVGGRDTIEENVEKFNITHIYVAMPSESSETIKEILDICKETGCQIKVLPSTLKDTGMDIRFSDLKEATLEDLLGRKAIKVNMDEIYDTLRGRTVLVTGGGGSIGSELCRQIASHSPERLIIFDIYENNAYAIGLELKAKYPKLNLDILIGSVRDGARLMEIFEKYRPDYVYHAAAHKHVPLMEDSPCEAIKNNVLGTYKTAYASLLFNVKKFVLISTDKAVNPTNVMGASKRMCEMVVQSFESMIEEGRAHEIHVPSGMDNSKFLDESGHIHTGTIFAATRFGNVLGSNGSVIPIFMDQIKKGGPVTVTHPDIVRYFMTIPEAVSLVLQAGCYAKNGDIFVFDMGDQVKIDDLARNLIKLNGLRPDVDIKIEYVGLRPGEKLYEEKLMADENNEKTANDLIYIGHPTDFDREAFLKHLAEKLPGHLDDEKAIIDFVKAEVPNYSTTNERFK